MNEAQALIHSRPSPAGGPGRSRLQSYARLTNFYPLYGAGNDQVDPVLAVQPVQFQRVIPRYRLSTSETRDQGLGPMFADIPETPARSLRSAADSEAITAPRVEVREGQPASGAATAASRTSLHEPWLGSRIDLYA